MLSLKFLKATKTINKGKREKREREMATEKCNKNQDFRDTEYMEIVVSITQS